MEEIKYHKRLLGNEHNSSTANPLSISKISVEQLFGHYNYNVSNSSLSDISKLLLIYGDNGTGKTTILKLFFYLLATRYRSGYKTKIAEIKFKKFSILFHNGLEVGALRENSSLGSFEYYISKNGKIINSVIIKTLPDNSVRLESGSEEEKKYVEVLDYLRNLNITTFFLSDDRKILNSAASNSNPYDENRESYYSDSDIIYSKSYEKHITKKILNEKRIAFESAIDRLFDWIRNKVLLGSRVGEKNSQVIIVDIIKDYTEMAETESSIKKKETLLKELDDLEIKMPSYVNLGLIDVFDTKTIRKSLKKAKDSEQIKFLSTLVSPFLEGINAKLNALENVEKKLNLFIRTVNDYFTNKEISFTLSKGFLLKQKDGDEINFNWLSSGEKQLLLLLINTITSADDATIFIIDEPEISLNVKWQRRLIKTLLEFSDDKNIQFILATHSIELLAAYKNNISKLVDQNA